MSHIARSHADRRTCAARVQGRFWLLASLLFVAAACLTFILCKWMTDMGGMQLPSGWTMSMMWMRMPGQSWPGVAGVFMGMWTLMIIAMMLPVMMPELARYRRALQVLHQTQIERLTFAVASGYFLMWGLFGVALFCAGVAFSALVMHLAALEQWVPMLSGGVVLTAGMLQMTRWKAKQLHCCLEALSAEAHTNVNSAWTEGMKLGKRCVYCCAPLTAILVVFGMMDIRMMTIVAIATTLERTTRVGYTVAQLTGMIAFATGAWLLTQAAI